MSDILSSFLAPMMGLIFVAFAIVWYFSRSSSVLDNWANANGFVILDSQYCSLSRGPFTWTTSRGQAVYRVKVRDPAGVVRSGWVRCGSWLLGLMTDTAEVRWDGQ